MRLQIQYAFTLVELLVVIAIVGILSGLIIIGMNNSVQSAKFAKAQIFSSSLRDSLLMNLVSEWRFDGTTSDSSLATNSDVLDTWGSNNGAVGTHQPVVRTGSNCVYGSCLSFSGSNSYVDLGNNISLKITGDITVAFWMNSGSVVSSGPTIYDNYYWDGSHYWGLFVGTSYNAIGVQWCDGVNPPSGWRYSNNNAFTVGKWTYITFVKTGTTGLFYSNGVAFGSTTGGTATIAYNSSGKFIIGTNGSNNGQSGSYAGLLDEVRVYSAAIPTSQIKNMYYAGLNKLLAGNNITRDEYQKNLRR